MTDLQIINPTVEILTQHKLPFLLGLLNNLRAKSNLPPMKSWKDSKAKIASAIIKLHDAHKEAVTQKVPAAPAAGAYDKKRQSFVSSGVAFSSSPKKPAPVKSIKAAKEKKPAAPAGDSELAKYIASKGFTPKTARARFRTHKVKKVDGRYVLNAELKTALE